MRKDNVTSAAITALGAVEELERFELKRMESISRFASSFYSKLKPYTIVGENFNPLAALTRHHLEELHSKQLFYLLNPKSSHDCGSLFLESFFHLLSQKAELKWLIESHSGEDLSNAVVGREVFIGWSYETDDFGKIDILIETAHCIIAVENKINAPEQRTQPQRYYNYCARKATGSQKKVLVLYLTLWGDHSESFPLNRST